MKFKQPPGSYVPESASERTSAPDALPTWTSLQSTSTLSWISTLCDKVLSSRTAFNAFLRTTLHADRSTKFAPDGSLFPLPLPKPGIFAQRKCGSRERKKRAVARAFHVMVMALNYWHADFKFVPLEPLSFRPNAGQQEALSNLWKLVQAFGSSSDVVSIPESGRRSSSLVSMLADLTDFMTWEGLPSDSYFRGFPGADGGLQEVAKVHVDKSRDESLVPYRALDASLLKITGTASWDPAPFLSDEFWMAYHEP